MKRFKEHRLIEGISGSQIKAALRDQSVIVGLEFEYFDNNMADGIIQQPDFEGNLDKLASQFDQLKKEVADTKRETTGDFEDEMKTEIGYTVENKQKEITKLKDELQTTPDTFEREEIDDEIKELKTSITALKKIKKEDAIIEWAEEQNIDYDFVERNPYAMPVVPNDLVAWWEDYHNIDYDSISQSIYSAILYDEEDDFYNLPNPRDKAIEEGFEDWEERAQACLAQQDLPFSNYSLGDTQKGGGGDIWSIVSDSTLHPDGGVEIISPQMSIVEAATMVPKVFAFIKKHGDTPSADYGLHVHMSYAGANMKKKLDVLKMMLFMDEGWIAKNFDDRVDSEYAQSMLSLLDKSFAQDWWEEDFDVELTMAANKPVYPRHKKPDPIKILTTYKPRKYWKQFKAGKYIPSSSHYNSVNWESLEEGHMEVRWLGGKGYHNKWNEVKEAMGRFANAMLLGLDPEYMKKEYIKKLYRLIKAKDKDKPSIDKIQTRAAAKLYKTVMANNEFIAGGVLKKNRAITLGWYEYKGLVYEIPLNKQNKWLGKITQVGKLAAFVKKAKKNNIKYADISFHNSKYIH